MRISWPTRRTRSKAQTATLSSVIGASLLVAACGDMTLPESGDSDTTDNGTATPTATESATGTDNGNGTGSGTGTGGQAQPDPIANPDVTLKDTFWRHYPNQVPTGAAATCYFLPRPDALPHALAECGRTTELATLLKTNGLCAPVADPATINNIPCADAKTISTFINNNLVFTAEGPVPDDRDRVRACAVQACAADKALETYCAYYKDRLDAAAAGKPVPAIARLDTDAEKTAIAACLNEVYGITVAPAGNAGKCSGPQPAPGYQCVQNCGPPVAATGDAAPGYSWLSPVEAANRENFGCPICLGPDTLISTPKGDVPVRRLRAGDQVLTLDESGAKVPTTVLVASSTDTPPTHALLRIRLEDGRTITASPGHPLTDGRPLVALAVGDTVAGSKVTAVQMVPWGSKQTYDILPAGSTGHYIADGVPLGSTLRQGRDGSSRVSTMDTGEPVSH